MRAFASGARGNLLGESDFRGHVTTHAYDAADRRVRIGAPLRRVTTCERNGLGQVLGWRTEGGDGAACEVRVEYAHPLNPPMLERRLFGVGDQGAVFFPPGRFGVPLQ